MMDENKKISNTIQDTKIFNLSTESSSGGFILNSDVSYKSYIQYNIGNMLRLDDSIAYILFSVPYCVIPNSFYNINYTSNTLIITLNGIKTIYILTRGNYTVTNFISYLSILLGSSWTISYNSITLLISISHTTYDFIFNSASTCDYILGFSGDTYSINKNINFIRCCNFLPIPRINIRCSEFSNTTSPGSFSNDIICSIPNSGRNTGQIFYQNNNSIKSLVKIDNLTSFSIKITDDKNNLINFNGISSYISFQFDIFHFYVPKILSFKDIINLASSNIKDDEED